MDARSDTDFAFFKELMNSEHIDMDHDAIVSELKKIAPSFTENKKYKEQKQQQSEEEEPEEQEEEEGQEEPEEEGQDDQQESEEQEDSDDQEEVKREKPQDSRSIFSDAVRKADAEGYPRTPKSGLFSLPEYQPLSKSNNIKNSIKKAKSLSQEPKNAPKDGNVDIKNLFSKTAFIPDDFTHINVEEENNNPNTRREKQELLFQLLKKYPEESKGQWSMSVPLFELKYELDRREQYRAEQDQILFMKELMKMILKGIEVANKKFGPFLELDGWSNSVTTDMSRYDRCMKALYHRYFKRKQMNPAMELMWLIVGSAIMWHLHSKFLGGTSSTSTSTGTGKASETGTFNNIHDIRPPPGTERFPFDEPGPSTNNTNGINIGSILKLFTR
jgi:hypothetical protein